MSILSDARKHRAILEQAVKSLDDKSALDAVQFYPKWEPDTNYDAGVRVRHDGKLYTVLTAHTSQKDWSPDVTPSLFSRVLIPDETVIPAWEQPDSTNPYQTGDRVTHQGKTWECTCANNVWEPGVYGWLEIDV